LDILKVIIFLIGLMGVVACGFFPGTREWVQAVYRRPWIACIIFTLYISLFLGSPRSNTELVVNPLDSYRYARIGLLGVLFVWSMLIVLFSNKRLKTGAGIFWTAAYASVAIISSVYSSNKMLTLFKGFEVFTAIAVMLALSIYLTGKQNINDFFGINIVPLMFLSFTSLAGAALMPGQALMHTGTGGIFAVVLGGVAPLVNPNTLTQISGMVCVLLFNEYLGNKEIKNRVSTFIVMVLFLFIAILAHSRTSLFAIMVSVSFVLIRNGSVGFATFSAWIAAIFALIGPVREAIFSFVYRGQNTAVFSSLSGRTEFWPLAWSKVVQSPIFGHGFYAAQREIFGISSVDNTYLEVILGVGVVGLVFFVIGIFFLARSLFGLLRKKSRNRNNYEFYNIETQLGIIFISLIIRSITGPSFQVFHINLILFLTLQVILASIYKMRRDLAAIS
jgi:O-antigen ligase